MALERMIPALGEVPRFPVTALPASAWRAGVLVRSPNWLGDAVMTLPALAVLRRMLPESRGLFVVCPENLAELFRMLPGIVNAVVGLEKPHAFPSRAELRAVRALNAGAALLFNNSFRDALWLKFCRIPHLCGAAARHRSFLLTRAFTFPPRRARELNRPHQAAKYLALAYALGASEWDGGMPEFVMPSGPETADGELHAVLREEHLLALAPGATYGAAKRWDLLRFRDVANWWIVKNRGKAVLLSAPQEAPEARRALSGLPEGQFYDLAGRTTLATLMLILRHAALCVANDSGTMHLAAALGTPGVAPFGSTDPAATSPLSKKWRILFDQQSCSPCFKRRCPKGHAVCMDAISVADVIDAIRDLG